MTEASDTLFLTGPNFEQLTPQEVLVTPAGQEQTTRAQALADAGGTVVEVDVAGGPFLQAGSITTIGTVENSITSLANHGILLGAGTAAVTVTAAMTSGQILVGQTGAAPLPKTPRDPPFPPVCELP